MRIERAANNPIVTPDSSASLGNNINGPSVIRVPAWVEQPLGRYYLYFAHHKGKFIRLAYADDITGPWHIHEPGALHLDNSLFPTGVMPLNQIPADRHAGIERLRAEDNDPLYTHIASPDAVIVPDRGEIRLYYHGMLENGRQLSRVAVSTDGLHFSALPDIITRPYLRVFRWQDIYYGMAMPGVFYRSENGLTRFEEGPHLFNPDMRHAALLLRGSLLQVFWTQVGHTPERILHSTIDISGDWLGWQVSDFNEVLRPETSWEGADLSIEPSVRGAIEVPANQLRDPGIFEEDGRTWLLYSIAGESGLAIAEVFDV